MSEEVLLNAGVLAYDTPEIVCQKDERCLVNETDTTPFWIICHLRITFDEGTYVGSGWVCAGTDKYHVVATAGHCVFANGKFAKSIQVTPALNGLRIPHKAVTIDSSGLRASEKWKAADPDKSEYDYGVILIPKGQGWGWLSMNILSDLDLKNRVVESCGYPADKSYGTMWLAGGPINKVEDRKIHYMNDTYGGQSGCPVYTWGNDNILWAVGIHAYGGCPNSAVRITRSVYDDFISWSNS